MCFEFGLEVEFGDAMEQNMARVDANGQGWSEEEQKKTQVYKVEVPANRYDLLCLEGIAQALRCYIGTGKMPKYGLIKPAQMQ